MTTTNHDDVPSLCTLLRPVSLPLLFTHACRPNFTMRKREFTRTMRTLTFSNGQELRTPNELENESHFAVTHSPDLNTRETGS